MQISLKTILLILTITTKIYYQISPQNIKQSGNIVVFGVKLQNILHQTHYFCCPLLKVFKSKI